MVVCCQVHLRCAERRRQVSEWRSQLRAAYHSPDRAYCRSHVETRGLSLPLVTHETVTWSFHGPTTQIWQCEHAQHSMLLKCHTGTCWCVIGELCIVFGYSKAVALQGAHMWARNGSRSRGATDANAILDLHKNYPESLRSMHLAERQV